MRIGIDFDLAAGLLVFTCPALVLPLLLGTFSLARYRQDALSKLAGLLAFKPVVATPVWALLAAFATTVHRSSRLNLGGSYLANPAYWLTLLPGLGLTIFIVLSFKKLFQAKTSLAFVLLGCDALRWITTFLIYPGCIKLSGPCSDITYHLALVLPNLYAIMALVIALVHARGLRSTR